MRSLLDSHCAAGMQFVCGFLFYSILSSGTSADARAGSDTVILPMLLRDACLCADSAHGPQGLLELRESKVLNLPHPNTGQPGCDDCAYACPFTDRTGTDPKAARPQGKRCRKCKIRIERATASCMLSTAEQRAAQKRALFFRRSASLLRMRISSPALRKRYSGAIFEPCTARSSPP